MGHVFMTIPASSLPHGTASGWTSCSAKSSQRQLHRTSRGKVVQPSGAHSALPPRDPGSFVPYTTHFLLFAPQPRHIFTSLRQTALTDLVWILLNNTDMATGKATWRVPPGSGSATKAATGPFPLDPSILPLEDQLYLEGVAASCAWLPCLRDHGARPRPADLETVRESFQPFQDWTAPLVELETTAGHILGGHRFPPHLVPAALPQFIQHAMRVPIEEARRLAVRLVIQLLEQLHGIEYLRLTKWRYILGKAAVPQRARPSHPPLPPTRCEACSVEGCPLWHIDTYPDTQYLLSAGTAGGVLAGRRHRRGAAPCTPSAWFEPKVLAY